MPLAEAAGYGRQPNGDLEQSRGEDNKDNNNNNDGLKNDDTKREKSAVRRSRISVIIEDFSFMWFTLSMNTGIISILMHQNPHQFNGLPILSTIFFVFDLVLFTTFFVILLLRIFLFPRKILDTIKTDLTECAMMGAVPIAFFTVVAQVALTGSTASWGGRAFALLAYVLWWIATALMLFVATLVILLVSKFNITNLESITPVFVLPFVGTTTDALVGAIICTTAASSPTPLLSPQATIPIIITSYLLTGLGFLFSIPIFSAFLVRLLVHGLPPPAVTPGLFLLIGPPGQTASALLQLGMASSIIFPTYNHGKLLTQTGGEVFSAGGALIGLLCLGLAVLFICFAVYEVIEKGFTGKHSYSLIWWGTIFPLATVNTAWILLAEVMDSVTFRVLASIFLVTLVILYLANWGFTIVWIMRGKLLNGRKSAAPWTERVKES